MRQLRDIRIFKTPVQNMLNDLEASRISKSWSGRSIMRIVLNLHKVSRVEAALRWKALNIYEKHWEDWRGNAAMRHAAMRQVAMWQWRCAECIVRRVPGTSISVIPASELRGWLPLGRFLIRAPDSRSWFEAPIETPESSIRLDRWPKPKSLGRIARY